MKSNDLFSYSEKRTLWQRFGLPIGLSGVGIILAVAVYLVAHTKSAPARRAPELVMVTSLPLPPPPPPPPPPPSVVQPETPKEQMMDQPAVIQEESKPEEAPAPEAGLGTNITGSGGPDGYGLGKSGNGVIGGTGRGNGGGGSRFGWYASQVQRVVADALRFHPRTKSGSYTVEVRIWPDPNGRIVRAKLARSTGDPAVDTAITQEILPGLQLQEPLPSGLTPPIVMRFKARRSN
jgi:outer membrane biosynthesis protein TonB